MKLNKLALTLTAAALLPTFAFAGSDQVAASFERDLQRGAAAESVALARTGAADPLVNAINVALYGATDQIVASFDRDLYRIATVSPTVLVAKAADPLDAINIAFRSGGEANAILASFQRDLYRVPTQSPVRVAAAADPLADAIKVALWVENGKPAVNVVMANKHRRGS